MAKPHRPMLSLVHPARPIPNPARNGLRRMNCNPSSANMIARASLCAPATTAQMSIGLATLSRVARAWRAGSPRAIRTTMALAARNGSTEETCSHHTMSCMFSPPSWFAAHWTVVMIGP